MPIAARSGAVALEADVASYSILYTLLAVPLKRAVCSASVYLAEIDLWKWPKRGLKVAFDGHYGITQ
jgi:hypothetical protein